MENNEGTNLEMKQSSLGATADVKIFTSAEVAKITRKKPTTIVALAKRYKGKPDPIGRKVGRDWVFTSDDVTRIAMLPRYPGRPRKQPVPDKA